MTIDLTRLTSMNPFKANIVIKLNLSDKYRFEYFSSSFNY